MKSTGFTVVELMVTLLIFGLLLGIGIPSLNKQIQKSRTYLATQSLLEAIQLARGTAVFQNARSILITINNQWEDGWILFLDVNNDGTRNDDEPVIRTGEVLRDVRIKAPTPMNEYISFISTGEGRKTSNGNDGAFLAGTIKICPDTDGEGYALILSRGGRTRVKTLTVAECDEI